MTTVDSHVNFIEGYADQLSVAPGESIGLCVSTSASHFSVEVSRVGAEQQVVWQEHDIPGKKYAVPDDAAGHGCKWPVALGLPVGQDWRSGYYHVLLRAEGGVTGEISFVVRSANPGREASILLQRTTNTDNAYNTWGGSSLYTPVARPGTRVSFDRPYAGFRDPGQWLFRVKGDFQDDLDRKLVTESMKQAFSEHVLPLSEFSFVEIERTGRFWYVFDAGVLYGVSQTDKGLDVYDAFSQWESCWHRWELPFVKWAESREYRIDYAVSSDLELNPEILDDYKLVLSVGHDEYWSAPMRDNLEAFIAAGGNAAFFSGNSVWWQVRSEANGRELVCYKDYLQDPVYESGDHGQLSTLWCHRLIGRPENLLTGVSFAYGGYHRWFDKYQDGPTGYTVHQPDHWAFAGTGLQRGDILGSQDTIIGYECDGCELRYQDGIPFSTGRDGTPESFEVLATAPAELTDADNSLAMVNEAIHGNEAVNRHHQPGAAVMGIYTRGGTVFTSGTTDWAHGLRGADPHVERITRNILDRLSIGDKL